MIVKSKKKKIIKKSVSKLALRKKRQERINRQIKEYDKGRMTPTKEKKMIEHMRSNPKESYVKHVDFAESIGLNLDHSTAITSRYFEKGQKARERAKK